jgi:hypothetical protein
VDHFREAVNGKHNHLTTLLREVLWIALVLLVLVDFLVLEDGGNPLPLSISTSKKIFPHQFDASTYRTYFACVDVRGLPICSEKERQVP